MRLINGVIVGLEDLHLTNLNLGHVKYENDTMLYYAYIVFKMSSNPYENAQNACEYHDFMRAN